MVVDADIDIRMMILFFNVELQASNVFSSNGLSWQLNINNYFT